MANALEWVSSPVTYYLSQDFESAGGYSGWTGSAGTTFNNTSSPLEGTGDLKIVGNGTTVERASFGFFGGIREGWIVALLKIVSLVGSGNTWFNITTNSGSNVSTMFLNGDGSVPVTQGGSVIGTMAAGTVTLGTLYYCKMHYKPGTGANCVASYELSTTGTFINSGSAYISTTTGPAQNDLSRLCCDNWRSGGDWRFDHIRVSAVDLGNSFSSWT